MVNNDNMTSNNDDLQVVIMKFFTKRAAMQYKVTKDCLVNNPRPPSAVANPKPRKPLMVNWCLWYAKGSERHQPLFPTNQPKIFF